MHASSYVILPRPISAVTCSNHTSNKTPTHQSLIHICFQPRACGLSARFHKSSRGPGAGSLDLGQVPRLSSVAELLLGLRLQKGCSHGHIQEGPGASNHVLGMSERCPLVFKGRRVTRGLRTRRVVFPGKGRTHRTLPLPGLGPSPAGSPTPTARPLRGNPERPGPRGPGPGPGLPAALCTLSSTRRDVSLTGTCVLSYSHLPSPLSQQLMASVDMEVFSAWIPQTSNIFPIVSHITISFGT